MIVGLIIIIVFPFIYFHTQMNNLNQKTDAIKKAVIEGKETYIDPLTGKMCWSENGEQVIWTEILSVERNIPEGCIVGDKVLRGVKTGKIYKNRSYEQFMNHVQRQVNNGEVWCYERKDYAKEYDDYSKEYVRYHMIDKYFYILEKTEEENIVPRTEEERLNDQPWKRSKVVERTIYLKKIYDLATERILETKEIDYKEYIKLGGN